MKFTVDEIEIIAVALDSYEKDHARYLHSVSNEDFANMFDELKGRVKRYVNSTDKIKDKTKEIRSNADVLPKKKMKLESNMNLDKMVNEISAEIVNAKIQQEKYLMIKAI
jgi:hypothetical protein